LVGITTICFCIWSSTSLLSVEEPRSISRKTIL